MNTPRKNISNSQYGDSIFTGGMMANFLIGFLTVFVSFITLGLAYPAMVCRKLKWKAEHTYLNGIKLIFDGNAMQLFGKFIWWMFLSLITFGLYYIFSAKLKLTEWETKHTHFYAYKFDQEKIESKFNGKWYQLFGVNFICRFVTVITLTLGYYWAHCYKERWYCKHKTIDGCELEFDGTGMQYFGKRIVWTLLTLITFGIYVFWLQIKSIKWTVSHTRLVNMPCEENFMKEEKLSMLPSAEKFRKAGKVVASMGFMISVFAILLCLLSNTTSNITSNAGLFGMSMRMWQIINIFFGTIGTLISILGYRRSNVKSIKLSVAGITLGVITAVRSAINLYIIFVLNN
jgi:hypothetical protein